MTSDNSLRGVSIYPPLDNVTHSIRLVEILPAANEGETISCSIRSTHLIPGLEYIALSYTWGEESDTADVMVNSYRVKVRANLASALWHFRQNHMFHLGNVKFRFWIDALCINQDDYLERNEQVARMGAIYRNASGVWSWLGIPDDSYLGHAFNSIHTLVSVIQNTDEINSGSLTPDALKRGIEWLASTQWFWQYVIEDNPDGTAPWNTISLFSEISYWKRIWIIQELALARTETHWFISGNAVLSCREFSLFFCFLQQLKQAKPACPQTDWTPDLNKYWTNFTSSHFGTFHTWERVARIKETRTIPPHLILELARFTTATEPRDMIFGLTGITNQIRPDYTKSIKSLYLHWFQEYFSTATEEALMFLRPSGAGLHRNDNQSYGLPTWCPRLFSLSESIYVGTSYYSGSVLMNKPSLSQPSILDQSILVAYGMRCGIVGTTLLTDPRTVDLPIDHICALWDICNKFLLWAKDDDIPGYEYFPLYALFLVLFQGCDRFSNKPIPYSAQPDSFAAQLFRLILLYGNGNLDNCDMGLLELEPCFRDCSDSNVNEIWAVQSKMFAANATTFQKLTLLTARWHELVGEKLFRTRDGLLGIGPIGVETGDEVCILEQCSMPVILRPCGNQRWEHIGTCWVLGLMNGEALTMFERGQLAAQKFEIQ